MTCEEGLREVDGTRDRKKKKMERFSLYKPITYT